MTSAQRTWFSASTLSDLLRLAAMTLPAVSATFMADCAERGKGAHTRAGQCEKGRVFLRQARQRSRDGGDQHAASKASKQHQAESTDSCVRSPRPAAKQAPIPPRRSPSRPSTVRGTERARRRTQHGHRPASRARVNVWQDGQVRPTAHTARKRRSVLRTRRGCQATGSAKPQRRQSAGPAASSCASYTYLQNVRRGARLGSLAKQLGHSTSHGGGTRARGVVRRNKQIGGSADLVSLGTKSSHDIESGVSHPAR